jgi:hypothetical protein
MQDENTHSPSPPLLNLTVGWGDIAGHDLVKAIKANGNVEDAIRQFENNAATPERIEEYIERPVTSLTSDLEKLSTGTVLTVGGKELAVKNIRIATKGDGETHVFLC